MLQAEEDIRFVRMEIARRKEEVKAFEKLEKYDGVKRDSYKKSDYKTAGVWMPPSGTPNVVSHSPGY